MALIDKASLLMVPSTYEAGTLYNVLPSGNRAPDSTDQNSGYDQTRADFTFDRGSNAAATRIGSDGLIKKYRENLFVQSNQFDTTWILGIATITGGQSGYDGTNNAWKLQDTAATGEHFVRQTPNVGNIVSVSVYAKANTLNFLWLRSVEGGVNKRTWFDLSSGSVGTSQGIDANIESVGNGWYRCSATFNHQSAFEYYIAISDANGSSSYTGDGTGSIYIQNAQLEASMVSTDYLDSGATTGKAGVLIDLPRINYDANGENGALLLEPSRQNKIQYSEFFGDSSWSQYVFSGASLTKTFGYTSPEGLDNAYKLDVVVGTGGVLFTHNFTTTASVDHTLSVWMKGEVGGEKVQIDLKNTSSSGVTGSLLTLTNQWKRYDLTITNDAGTSRGFQFRMQQSSGISDQTLYVYGAQAEASASYVSSYIPNHGESSGVTRAADSCLGAGDVDSINSVEGVLYWEGSFDSTSTTAGAVALIGSNSNRVQLYNSGSSVVALVTPNGSTSFTASTSGSIDITSNHRYAVKWALNDFALWVDGVEIATDTSGATFNNDALNELRFSDFGSNYLYANVKQLAVFNEALSDSELATLTTL